MYCVICGKRATKVRKVRGKRIGFCKYHDLKDYKIKKFWGDQY